MCWADTMCLLSSLIHILERVFETHENEDRESKYYGSCSWGFYQQWRSKANYHTKRSLLPQLRSMNTLLKTTLIPRTTYTNYRKRKWKLNQSLKLMSTLAIKKLIAISQRRKSEDQTSSGSLIRSTLRYIDFSTILQLILCISVYLIAYVNPPASCERQSDSLAISLNWRWSVAWRSKMDNKDVFLPSKTSKHVVDQATVSGRIRELGYGSRIRNVIDRAVCTDWSDKSCLEVEATQRWH